MDKPFYDCFSVELLPMLNARVAFVSKTTEVFRDSGHFDTRITPDGKEYVSWGGSDQLPYDIIRLIEADETLATCQLFNAEVCYGSGCNIAPPNPPQRSRMMSRTSFLTMTSTLTFSASVRTLSTSALPCQCLFSTRTVQRLCAC